MYVTCPATNELIRKWLEDGDKEILRDESHAPQSSYIEHGV
jgi:hypothetical protein